MDVIYRLMKAGLLLLLSRGASKLWRVLPSIILLWVALGRVALGVALRGVAGGHILLWVSHGWVASGHHAPGALGNSLCIDW